MMRNAVSISPALSGSSGLGCGLELTKVCGSPQDVCPVATLSLAIQPPRPIPTTVTAVAAVQILPRDACACTVASLRSHEPCGQRAVGR
jgi:hypothetical protein